MENIKSLACEGGGVPSDPDCLYYFNEPLLWSVRVDARSFLVTKLGEVNQMQLLLATEVASTIISDVVENKIKLRDAFLSGKSWLVQVDNQYAVRRYTRLETVSDKFLPDPDVFLSVEATEQFKKKMAAEATPNHS
jgi:hypothetical protein